MPCTGRLTAMFSELDSTRPTAPTLFSKPAVGGGEGGATVACTGWDRTIAKIANVRMRAAMIGKPYLVMIEVSLQSIHGRSQKGFLRHFRFDNPAVVHVCDAVGKIKDAAVMGHNDHRAIFPHGDFGEQIHHDMAGFMIQGRSWLVADDQARLMHQCASQ